MMKKLFSILTIALMICANSFSQNPFGNGNDGPLSVLTGETYYTDVIRSPLESDALAGTNTVSLSDASQFSAGDEVLIICMQDSSLDSAMNNTGIYETAMVQSVSANVLNLTSNLQNNYEVNPSIKHQAIRIPNYTDVLIEGTITCSAWDGTTGGVLFFRASQSVTINASGIIEANGKGYRGGTQFGDSHGGGQGGESFVGAGGDGGHYTNNPHGKVGAGGGGAAYNGYYGGNALAGGGGGGTNTVGLGSSNFGGAGGGGGGHAGCGGGAGYGTFGYGGQSYGSSWAQNGGEYFSGNGSNNGTGGGGGGGGTYGSAELNRLYLGSGGGCGGRHSGYTPTFGGNGGGILYFSTNVLTNNGIISCNGNSPGNPSCCYNGAGGGGAGGSILINAIENNNLNTIKALGGNGGTGHYGNVAGDGGKGRIRLNYSSVDTSGSVDPLAFESSLSYGVFVSTLPNTSNENNPYTINAFVFDSLSITGANLYYRVNNGSFQQIAMTSTNDTLFTADIPAQLYGSAIDYYVTAASSANNFSAPNNAPSEYYSFEITVFVPRYLSIVDNLNGDIDLNWIEPVDLSSFSHYSVYRSEISNFTPDAISLIANNINDTFYTDNTVADFHNYYYKVAANYAMSSGNEFDYAYDSIYVNIDSITTVKGYAFLEGQTNHAGVKIKFHPISPSAVADSVNTNALGYFEIHINPGTYTITYEKVNYQTYYIKENLSIIEDLDLEESTILYLGNIVSGAVSGVWNGIYTVVGDIYINSGDSLIIESGSDIRFQQNYQFDINGYLAVNGTSSEKVLFTSAPYNQIQNWGQWQGLDFNNSSDDNSYMNYSIIEYTNHAIYTYYASPDFTNCEFRHNSSHTLYFDDYSNPSVSNSVIWHGGDRGIHIYDVASPIFNDVEVYNCSGYGIYMYNQCSPKMTNLDIHDNGSHGIFVDYNYCNAEIYDSKIYNNGVDGLYIQNNYDSEIIVERCEVYNNGDDGVYIHDSDVDFKFCKVYANNSQGFEINDYCEPLRIYDCEVYENNSYGIFSDYDNDVYVYRTTVRNNNGTGIYIDDNYTYYNIYKSIIAYNNGDGIYKRDNDMTIHIRYNTIYGNYYDGIEMNNSTSENIYNNIIVNNGNYGLRSNTYIETFEYNNIFGNASGEISNLGNVPIDSWTFVSYNANGDDADIYLNISEEPNFMFSDSLDFELQANSPCINAGDPSVIDEDGTISDMGALYRDAGNPHKIYVNGTGNQTVSINWENVDLDSLISYNVFYKLDTVATYTYFNNTTDSFITVNGLTNNELYNFTVTGVFASYESAYAPKVSERPGEPDITLDPIALNVVVPSVVDTLTEYLTISNPGSRELNVDFNPYSMPEGAVRFDGSGDYIDYGDADHLDELTSMTVECWYIRYNNGWHEIMSKHYRAFYLGLNSSEHLHFSKGYDSNNNYQDFYSGYYLNSSEWYHIAVTWENSTIRFYVNGNLVNTQSCYSNQMPNYNYNFVIGRRGSENTRYLNGHVAEARIWNYARSYEQIQSTMNRGLAGDEEGLIGYWPLHEDFNDHSVYGLQGTDYGHTYINTSALATNTSVDETNYGFYILPQLEWTIQPAETVNVPIQFPNLNMGTQFMVHDIGTDVDNTDIIEYEIAITYGENVPSSPVHFIPVASTGAPYDIIITDAKIDGATLSIGDEIAVFDGAMCVGSGIFDGTFNFVLTAWEDTVGDGSTGFIDGNDMIFKIYDTSADLDATEVNEEYEIGDGNFGYGEFSALSLSSTVYQIQQVPVEANMYSLVSFNLLPRYPAATSVFGDLENMSIVYNDAGNAWIPQYGINSIGDIDFRDGFHLFSSIADTINFEGTMIDPMAWNINVDAGKWNSIAFLGHSPLDVTTAFPSDLVDSIDIVQASNGNVWIPSLAVNSIINLEPGKGYQIALSSASDISFNYQTGGAASTNKYFKPKTEYFEFAETGLPYTIVVDELENSSLLAGDEIAAFSQGICVGAGVYDGLGKCVFTAWQGDSDNSLIGFSENEIIEIRTYEYISGSETIQNIVSLNNKPNNLKYKGESYSFIAFGDAVSSSEILFSVLPNPGNQHFAIDVSLVKDGNLSVKIFDVNGKLVKSLADGNFVSGNYNFIWNRNSDNGNLLPAGVYNIRVISNETILSRKLVTID